MTKPNSTGIYKGMGN